ncbi:MAG: 4Fe-4S dicluster domain-containing protein [Sedimentisphaerales bacterium]|nr:4Fe-4S dicluster domain-containing protein [Sedimentisphaerales bacterium]
MVIPLNISFIQTAKERCRVCYTCVRECPAKAIRIADGQAEVIPERCISCGNCVRVCSQQAKQVVSTIDQVDNLLAGPDPVAACIAPTFPADFPDYDYRCLVGMIRQLGFNLVNEVAFGADLVAKEYKKLFSAEPNGKNYISTACPAIIGYVEKYHPDLVDSLVPIVSPMLATARALHLLHGNHLKVVFIGPCIAKKCEAVSENTLDEVDAVLTFAELRQMFEQKHLDPKKVTPDDFDPPHAGLGALFPISRGLLQAADITEDLVAGEVVATDGKTNFVEAIREFESGALDARLLEVLACNGCIMGAGMTDDAPLFSRRSRVSRYVRKRMENFNKQQWKSDLKTFNNLDLSRIFTKNDQRIPVPFEDEINLIMVRMGKHQPEDELNCGACGYDTCREHAVAIFKGLAESEMCLPNTIEQLRSMINQLASSNELLANTQEALMQSEKLASMGQLAAGIAHEVNNPLGVVLMYAHMLLEQFEEKPELSEDLRMITEQADRCKKIVSGLLHFARQNKVQLKPTDICDLVNRIIKVNPPPDGIEVHQDIQIDDPVVKIDPDQIIQVITNLVKNAFSAMDSRGNLTLRITGDDNNIKISVIDTGSGIPRENIPKLFEPFFTTKKIGKGTGLGLAVTYGIIKMHQGNITVESNDDPTTGPTGSTFTVQLPRI